MCKLTFVRNDDATFARRRSDQLASVVAVVSLQKQFKTESRHADVWARALQTLRSQLSVPQFAMLADSTLLSLDNKRAVVCVAHTFTVQWVTEHTDVVLACQAALAAHVDNQDVKLEFVDRRVGERVVFTDRKSGTPL